VEGGPTWEEITSAFESAGLPLIWLENRLMLANNLGNGALKTAIEKYNRVQTDKNQRIVDLITLGKYGPQAGIYKDQLNPDEYQKAVKRTGLPEKFVPAPEEKLIVFERTVDGVFKLYEVNNKKDPENASLSIEEIKKTCLQITGEPWEEISKIIDTPLKEVQLVNRLLTVGEMPLPSLIRAGALAYNKVCVAGQEILDWTTYEQYHVQAGLPKTSTAKESEGRNQRGSDEKINFPLLLAEHKKNSKRIVLESKKRLVTPAPGQSPVRKGEELSDAEAIARYEAEPQGPTMNVHRNKFSEFFRRYPYFHGDHFILEKSYGFLNLPKIDSIFDLVDLLVMHNKFYHESSPKYLDPTLIKNYQFIRSNKHIWTAKFASFHHDNPYGPLPDLLRKFNVTLDELVAMVDSHFDGREWKLEKNRPAKPARIDDLDSEIDGASVRTENVDVTSEEYIDPDHEISFDQQRTNLASTMKMIKEQLEKDGYAYRPVQFNKKFSQEDLIWVSAAFYYTCAKHGYFKEGYLQFQDEANWFIRFMVGADTSGRSFGLPFYYGWIVDRNLSLTEAILAQSTPTLRYRILGKRIVEKKKPTQGIKKPEVKKLTDRTPQGIVDRYVDQAVGYTLADVQRNAKKVTGESWEVVEGLLRDSNKSPVWLVNMITTSQGVPHPKNITVGILLYNQGCAQGEEIFDMSTLAKYGSKAGLPGVQVVAEAEEIIWERVNPKTKEVIREKVKVDWKKIKKELPPGRVFEARKPKATLARGQGPIQPGETLSDADALARYQAEQAVTLERNTGVAWTEESFKSKVKKWNELTDYFHELAKPKTEMKKRIWAEMLAVWNLPHDSKVLDQIKGTYIGVKSSRVVFGILYKDFFKKFGNQLNLPSGEVVSKWKLVENEGTSPLRKYDTVGFLVGAMESEVGLSLNNETKATEWLIKIGEYLKWIEQDQERKKAWENLLDAIGLKSPVNILDPNTQRLLLYIVYLNELPENNPKYIDKYQTALRYKIRQIFPKARVVGTEDSFLQIFLKATVLGLFDPKNSSPRVLSAKKAGATPVPGQVSPPAEEILSNEEALARWIDEQSKQMPADPMEAHIDDKALEPLDPAQRIVDPTGTMTDQQKAAHARPLVYNGALSHTPLPTPPYFLARERETELGAIIRARTGEDLAMPYEEREIIKVELESGRDYVKRVIVEHNAKFPHRVDWQINSLIDYRTMRTVFTDLPDMEIYNFNDEDLRYIFDDNKKTPSDRRKVNYARSDIRFDLSIDELREYKTFFLQVLEEKGTQDVGNILDFMRYSVSNSPKWSWSTAYGQFRKIKLDVRWLLSKPGSNLELFYETIAKVNVWNVNQSSNETMMDFSNWDLIKDAAGITYSRNEFEKLAKSVGFEEFSPQQRSNKRMQTLRIQKGLLWYHNQGLPESQRIKKFSKLDAAGIPGLRHSAGLLQILSQLHLETRWFFTEAGSPEELAIENQPIWIGKKKKNASDLSNQSKVANMSKPRAVPVSPEQQIEYDLEEAIKTNTPPVVKTPLDFVVLLMYHNHQHPEDKIYSLIHFKDAAKKYGYTKYESIYNRLHRNLDVEASIDQALGNDEYDFLIRKMVVQINKKPFSPGELQGYLREINGSIKKTTALNAIGAQLKGINIWDIKNPLVHRFFQYAFLVHIMPNGTPEKMKALIAFRKLLIKHFLPYIENIAEFEKAVLNGYHPDVMLFGASYKNLEKYVFSSPWSRFKEKVSRSMSAAFGIAADLVKSNTDHQEIKNPVDAVANMNERPRIIEDPEVEAGRRAYEAGQEIDEALNGDDLKERLLDLALRMNALLKQDNGKAKLKSIRNPANFKTIIEYFQARGWRMSSIDQATLKKFLKDQQKHAQKSNDQAREIMAMELTMQLADALAKDATGKTISEEFEQIKHLKAQRGDVFERIEQNIIKMSGRYQGAGKMAGNFTANTFRETWKFMLALGANLLIDACLKPTITMEDFINLGLNTHNHAWGLITFGFGASSGSAFSKMVGDRIFANSLEGLQYQLKNTMIRKSGAYALASAQVGFRTYIRSQIGFIVGSLVNGFLHDDYNDPEFWNRQIKGIASFMMAGAITRGGVFTIGKILEGRHIIKAGSAVAALHPAALIWQTVYLTADLFLSPRLLAEYEKSVLQAKLEPEMSQAYRDYLAVLTDRKETAMGCNQSNKQLVLECIQMSLIRGIQQNWQYITQFELNAEAQQHMTQFLEWEKAPLASGTIASFDNMYETYEHSMDAVNTPSTVLFGGYASRKLYQYWQTQMPTTPWKNLKQLKGEAIRVLLPKDDEVERMVQGAQYFTELDALNSDYTRDMVAMFREFGEEILDENSKIAARYYRIRDVQNKAKKALEQYKDLSPDEAEPCHQEVEDAYNKDLATLLESDNRQINLDQFRVLQTKRKSNPFALPFGMFREKMWFEEIPALTLEGRVSAASMLDLIYLMAQIFHAVNPDESRDAVSLLMMIHQELIDDIKKHIHIKDKNPYLEQHPFANAHMLETFMPFGYDHEHKKMNGDDYLNWSQSSKRKYMLLLPSNYKNNVQDYIYARVVVDEMVERGMIQLKFKRSDALYEKAIHAAQTYLMWTLGHNVEDFRELLTIDQMISEESLDVLSKVTKRYVQMGAMFLSQYECEGVEDLYRREQPVTMKDRADACPNSKSIGVQILYQPAPNASKKDLYNMNSKVRNSHEWARRYQTQLGYSFMAPLGQVFIHDQYMNELLQ
jgi:hypothetical protein